MPKLLLCLLLALSLSAAPAIVDSGNAHAVANGTNGATTSAINTIGATLLILAISAYTGGPADNPDDSAGNTWTPLTTYAQAAGSFRVTIYYDASPTTSATHTFSNSGTGNYTSIAVIAFSGTGATPFNTENGADSVDAALGLQTGAITVADGDLVISAAGIYFGAPSVTLSVDGGLTITDQVHNAGVSEGIALAWGVKSGSGGINPTWTPSSSKGLAVTIADFDADAGGAPPSARRRIVN